MRPYEQLILERLQGATPSAKFEFLEQCLEFLRIVAYPKIGTTEDMINIDDIALDIQEAVSLAVLEMRVK